MPATDAIIYLRLSDFRDEDDTTFEVRESELRQLAADLHLTVLRVAVENDLNGNGKSRGASAYKTPRKVTTSSGLVNFRTNRPEFERVVLDLQRGAAHVLIVADDSRISRNHRDGLDLLDACQVSRASAVAPDEDGRPRWILTNGGTHAEIASFLDRINDARKYSDDIAAKVRKGRRRWAGRSYQGGIRPYGFRPQEDTQEHHRNLVIDEAEAEVIRKAADDLLRGVSIKAVARDLRDRNIPTATGRAVWNTMILRGVLLKPSVAGLAVLNGGELTGAPWPAILNRPVWERVRDLLTDPARVVNQGRGREPRWLVSVFATCGVCGKTLRVGGSSGPSRKPAYVGTECGHVVRAAAWVDELIGEAVIEVLDRPEADGLLRPPPRPGGDTGAQRAELRKLADRRSRVRAMAASGDIELDDLSGILREISQAEARLSAQIAASEAAPDPLEEFRGQPARAVWEALSMPRRRAVVQLLFPSVVIQPGGRAGYRDPELIVITPRPEIASR